MANLEDIDFKAMAILCREVAAVLRAAEGRDVPNEQLSWVNIMRCEALTMAACAGLLLPVPEG